MIRAVLLLILAASQGWALSCMPADLKADYARAQSSDTAFIIVDGILRFDAEALPRTDFENQMETPPETRIPARLVGQSMTRAGFGRAFDQPLDLVVHCAGPWCASATDGGRVLAFVAKTPEGYSLSISPCPGMVYPNPTAAMRRTLLNCMRGAVCRAP